MKSEIFGGKVTWSDGELVTDLARNFELVLKSRFGAEGKGLGVHCHE